jgi:hypothetical protein
VRKDGIGLTFLGRYSSGSFDESAAEITAHDAASRRLFTVDAKTGTVDILDFAGDPAAGTAGDLAPEGLSFIPAADSPNGRPLLVVGHEVSGTTAVYQVGQTLRRVRPASRSTTPGGRVTRWRPPT